MWIAYSIVSPLFCFFLYIEWTIQQTFDHHPFIHIRPQHNHQKSNNNIEIKKELKFISYWVVFRLSSQFLITYIFFFIIGIQRFTKKSVSGKGAGKKQQKRLLSWWDKTNSRVARFVLTRCCCWLMFSGRKLTRWYGIQIINFLSHSLLLRYSSLILTLDYSLYSLRSIREGSTFNTSQELSTPHSDAHLEFRLEKREKFEKKKLRFRGVSLKFYWYREI